MPPEETTSKIVAIEKDESDEFQELSNEVKALGTLIKELRKDHDQLENALIQARVIRRIA